MSENFQLNEFTGAWTSIVRASASPSVDPGSITLSSQTKPKIYVFTASLLDVQHYKDSV